MSNIKQIMDAYGEYMENFNINYSPIITEIKNTSKKSAIKEFTKDYKIVKVYN